MVDPACVMAEDKRLELLLTYTVFHIGVYISLTTILIGATVSGHLNDWRIRIAVGFFIIAGMCGGTIAANIAEGRLTAARVFEQDAPLRVWGINTFSLHSVATAEHAAFWLGILVLAYLYFLPPRGGGLKPAK